MEAVDTPSTETGTVAKAAHRLMTELVHRLGPRLAGSKACLDCAEALHAAVKSHADQAGLDRFSVHPGAFLGFIRIMVVLYVASIPALIFVPWLAFGFLAAGTVVLVGEFFLYHCLVDVLFPRKEACNVWASLEPAGEVRSQLIVSGHHDSAPLYRFYSDRPELYARRLFGGMGIYFAQFLVAFLLGLFQAGTIPGLVAAGAFALGILMVLPLWTFALPEGAPGAGDNLAASTLALEVLKLARAKRDKGEGLQHTRLVFVSFDAEEAGLRGARAWAKKHAGLLGSVPGWNFNMDCLYKAEEGRLLTSDINGSVALDTGLARHLEGLAALRGRTVAVEPIAFMTGGTDAAELAKAGVRATTFIGMTWNNSQRSPSYHTLADMPEAVGLEVLELCADLALGLARDIDAGRVPG